MSGKKKHEENGNQGRKLRDNVEDQLARRSDGSLKLPSKNPEGRTHELQVHQVELEMQDEALDQSHAEVGAGLKLYDFAPMSHITLDRDGTIRRVNLTGARLLGMERGRLIGRRFGFFVSAADRPAFNAFMEKVFASQTKETCEAALCKEEKCPPSPERSSNRHFGETGQIIVHIEAIASKDGQECRAAMADITDRKRAEEALRESEEKFKATFECSHDAITLITENGKIIDCNQSALRLFGLDRKEDFGNKRPVDFSPKFQDGGMESPELARQYINRCIESGKPQRFEWLLQRTTGEIIPTEIILTSYLLKDEKILQASIRDITERKQSDKTIRESEERFRQVVENILEVFWLEDVHNGRILYISPAYETIWGRTIEEMYREGPSFMENVYPDDKERVSVSHRALYEENQPFDEEYRVVRPDQSIRWVWARCYPIFDMNGKMARYAGIAEDITKRKRAEDALRESEQKFRELFDSISDLIYAQDLEGRYLTVNRAFRTILGYDTDEFIGRTGADFMKPESRPLFFSKYLEGVKKQGHLEGIAAFIRKEGTKFYVEYRSKLVRPEHGPPYISGIGRDITERILSERERERLKAQLIQAQKMESVGRLAGGVAHDFNNMLGVILGRVELMLMGMEPGDSRYADLEEIQKAALRSADLTRQLLAFARKQTISPKVLDLNNTLDGMLNMLRRLIGEDIDLVWKPDANLWAVKMDAAQVDQVLANLCVNARDAISGTGNVTIETQNVVLDESYSAMHVGFIPGEYVMLAVSDDGCGMNQETQSHLFEPFFTTKEVGKGTGLGLATVYGIVKQNNGFANVYSEVGKGTTFKIYFPRHEGNAVTETTPDPLRIPEGHGETVLLVEDDLSILAMGKAMLERLGYAILTAGDTNQALDLAKVHGGPIHLLMTDVVMPQMSGKDLALQMRTLNPEIKVLFMSGYTTNIIAHRGILDEAVHFIQKPFSMKNLASKVRKALEGR